MKAELSDLLLGKIISIELDDEKLLCITVKKGDGSIYEIYDQEGYFLLNIFKIQ